MALAYFWFLTATVPALLKPFRACDFMALMSFCTASWAPSTSLVDAAPFAALVMVLWASWISSWTLDIFSSMSLRALAPFLTSDSSFSAASTSGSTASLRLVSPCCFATSSAFSVTSLISLSTGLIDLSADSLMIFSKFLKWSSGFSISGLPKSKSSSSSPLSLLLRRLDDDLLLRLLLPPDDD